MGPLLDARTVDPGSKRQDERQTPEEQAQGPDLARSGHGQRPAADPSSSHSSVGDSKLVARASRGDVGAFSELVQAHSDRVRRIATRILGKEEAQDACQEVWVRVWANIKNFRGESAFGTWLHRIAVNTCLSILRKKQAQETQELGEETPEPCEPAGGDADPEAAALNSERREELRVALGQVRAEHRAALVLRHAQGLSYAEVAEVLDVPDGTVKGWVSRGRAAMLVALAQEKGERAQRVRGPCR